MSLTSYRAAPPRVQRSEIGDRHELIVREASRDKDVGGSARLDGAGTRRRPAREARIGLWEELLARPGDDPLSHR
jgi:hypothetical protein